MIVSSEFINNVYQCMNALKLDLNSKQYSNLPKPSAQEHQKYLKRFQNLLILCNIYTSSLDFFNKKVEEINDEEIKKRNEVNQINKIKETISIEFRKEEKLLRKKYFEKDEKWEDDWELIDMFDNELDLLKNKFEKKHQELIEINY